MTGKELEWDRIIIGIDPGTNVMGYGILGVKHHKPSMIAMGVLMLNKFDDHYLRLRRISERVTNLVEQYLPDEMAIEAPFYGKNVQSMLKLGRAQGVAMAAACSRKSDAVSKDVVAALMVDTACPILSSKASKSLARLVKLRAV